MDSTLKKDDSLSLGDQLSKANVGSDLELDAAVAASQPRGNIGDNSNAGDITADTTSASTSSADQPKTTRRKSSLVTLESKLHRLPSAEKHVTIQLSNSDKGDQEDDQRNHVDDTSRSDDNARELLSPAPTASDRQLKEQDEASKMELARILEQFDPLGEPSASSEITKKKDLSIDEIIIQDRGIAPSKLKGESSIKNKNKSKDKEQDDEKQSLTTTSTTTLPNLTNASESSLIALGSPQSSHDVLVPPATSAFNSNLTPTSPSKPKSTSKKKVEGGSSRSKSSNKDTDGLRRSEASSSLEKPKTIPFDFHKFLEQMRHKSALPITGYFQSFLREFGRRPWTVNEQIKIIHDFLDFIAGKMEMCDLWKNASEQEMENLREGMEKLVMNRLFAYTFSPNTADDAERDNVLSQKIQIFRWIREEHLDIPKSPHNESYLNYAQTELKKINSYKAPRDKVICILNCCKFIFTLIRRSEGSAKGADTFLPILIYVVLRANPPHLVSNVQYISRFRNPEKLQAEAGYYLASLMGAISFIENLEGSSLSISAEEFDQQIERTMQELEQERQEAERAALERRQQQSSNGGAEPRISEKSSPRNTAAATQQHRQGGGTTGKFSFFGSSSSSATPPPPNTSSRRREPNTTQTQEEFNEKAALKQEMQRQEQQQQGRSSSIPSTLKEDSSSSFSPWTSIVNPAAALIEKGAQTATRTIQKPMQFMEKMFLESDDEEMAKPYPLRPGQHQPPQTPQQQSPARPPAPDSEDSFGDFMYVPAGGDLQVPSPQQHHQLYPGALGGSPMQYSQERQHHARSRTASGTSQHEHEALPQVHPPQQQQMNREQYQQALETLRDMFPTCEAQVIDTILQANEGRVTPSIDNLLEIASMADQQQQGLLQLDPLVEEDELDSVSADQGRQGYFNSDKGMHYDATPRGSTDGQRSMRTPPPPSSASGASTPPSLAPESQEREVVSKQESTSKDLISF